MPETHFDEWVAARYERLWPELFDPSVINTAVAFLAALCENGTALEMGVGTGRIAGPLSRRGVDVHGIELSPAMAARAAVPVTIGDFATTRLERHFDLVYLLRNTITNLTTRDEQIQAFRNAAAHLRLGGTFLIENYIPAVDAGEHVFIDTPDHFGYEVYDAAKQIAISHHRWTIDGEVHTFSSPHRYVWPSELDLMAAMAGLVLRERWADWHRAPFTSGSRNHISVWELR